MANFNQITPAQLNMLLRMAGKQLNINPDTLRQQLEKGDLSSVSAGMGGQMGQQLNDLLSNPQKMRQMVSQTDINGLFKNLK